MMTPWGYPDFDAHEALHFIHDETSGLRAIIALHSTHIGPAAGGVRFWHYADDAEALTDALRLSRGMSYKNAMAGLPLGGGKAVLLASEDRAKSPELLAAYGQAVESLCGRYITAEDVGMNVSDMIEVRRQTRFVAGLPVEGGGVGGDPGPHTSLGVFLGIKAAAKRALGKDSLAGLHIALQGAGSVATGVAMLAAAEGAKLSIAALQVSIVAGGANNQLATREDGARLYARGILYAPDYVINAGGIINVSSEFLGDADTAVVRGKIAAIPGRLDEIWAESARDGRDPAAVADMIAQRLIGRGR